MLSCGLRNIWRAMVRVAPRSDGADVFDYDKFVMPLVCVCGTVVYIGAGMVLEDKGACRRPPHAVPAPPASVLVVRSEF